MVSFVGFMFIGILCILYFADVCEKSNSGGELEKKRKKKTIRVELLRILGYLC